MAQILAGACRGGALTRPGLLNAFQSLNNGDTAGLVPPLDYGKPGKIPARQVYIVRPDSSVDGASGSRRSSSPRRSPSSTRAERGPTMRRTMQSVPLQIRRILEHGSGFHGRAQVITAVPGGLRTSSYAEVGRNVARLAHALHGAGVGTGDRVATFMWNNQEHVEAYFAAPCMGAVIHPLNIRHLAPAPLAAFVESAAPNKGAGVPTVWQGLLQYLEQHPEVDISSLHEAIVGGSACPPSLMRAYAERLGVTLLHA